VQNTRLLYPILSKMYDLVLLLLRRYDWTIALTAKASLRVISIMQAVWVQPKRKYSSNPVSFIFV
jgi:hypothetical protein